MKKLIICGWIICFIFVLTGCGKCEHKYYNSVITKESTCTEEGKKTFTCSLCEETKIESIEKKSHKYKEEVTKESTFDEEGEKIFTCENCGDTYIEPIPVLDSESYNQNIYEQIVKFYDNEDYINVLIARRNAASGKGKDKIYEISDKVFELPYEYFTELIQNAIESGDYATLDVLFYYMSPEHHIKFSYEQGRIYSFLSELQGEYMYYESTDDNIQMEIDGFNLKIGDEKYVLNFIFTYNDKFPEYASMKCFFEGGEIEKTLSDIIVVSYEDGTFVKYITKEWREEQKRIEEKEIQREEEKKKKEEKEKQEYLANEPQIGMTVDEVKKSNWGSPKKINKTTYAWGIKEQWCYPDNKYIYFEDGVVTAIQE